MYQHHVKNPDAEIIYAWVNARTPANMFPLASQHNTILLQGVGHTHINESADIGNKWCSDISRGVKGWPVCSGNALGMGGWETHTCTQYICTLDRHKVDINMDTMKCTRFAHQTRTCHPHIIIPTSSSPHHHHHPGLSQQRMASLPKCGMLHH